MEDSKIEWTDHTFNPWIGCSHVHKGCTNCYAEADQANRRGRVVWGAHGTRSRTSDAYWRQPLKWEREAKTAGERRRVFCASLADVFEDWQGPIVNADDQALSKCSYPPCTAHTKADYWPLGVMCPFCLRECAPVTMNDLRRDLFALIDQTPHLDWLLLTKRPENVRKMWQPVAGMGRCAMFPDCTHPDCQAARVRSNVWLGYSASDQPTLEQGIGPLLACHDLCPVQFLSLEPLLGPIDLTPWLEWGAKGPPWLCGWVIIGCESNGKRVGRLGVDSEAEWWQCAIVIADQCKDAGVPVFVKQVPGQGNVLHDPDYWHKNLRARQFPQLATEARP